MHAELKGDIDPEKVVFKNTTGTVFAAERKGKSFEITLAAASGILGYELYAIWQDGDSTERSLGKLKVTSYPQATHTVKIVPMQEGTIDRDKIQAGLDKIYAPYGISWQVDVEEHFADRSWDLNGQGLQSSGSGFFSQYTPEMKALNAAYGQARSFDATSVYLFYFAEDDAEENNDLLGDMPLASQVGYIFSKKIDEQAIHTMAHELGHGLFHLKHPFSGGNDHLKGTTTNLMDYKRGQTLTKYQWDQIHQPKPVLFPGLQGEGEGEYTLTPVDKQHALLFNHVYENNNIASLNYLKAIEDAIALGNDDALDLAYTEDEAEKWTKEQKQWIDGWKIRARNSDQVFTDIIKSVKETRKDQKIEKIVLRPKHIYIGKYKYEDVEYPVAIYGNGENAVMTKAFTKIQVTNARELEDKEKKEHIYCDETYTKYLIIAFYEVEKDDPSMIMQVEKFDISQMQNTKEKWLEYLGILGEPVKYEITQSQLEEIFPNTDTTRLKEVMESINNNCSDFNINTRKG